MSSRRGSSVRNTDNEDQQKIPRPNHEQESSTKRFQRAPSIESRRPSRGQSTDEENPQRRSNFSRASRGQSTDEENSQRRSSFSKLRPRNQSTDEENPQRRLTKPRAKVTSSSEDNDRINLPKIPGKFANGFELKHAKRDHEGRLERRRGSVKSAKSESENEGLKVRSRTNSLTRQDDNVRKCQNEIKNEMKKEIKKDINEETEPWPCEHCTFINEAKLKVCTVCCKTRSIALPPVEPEDPQTISKPDGLSDAERKATDSDNSLAKGKGRFRKISFSFGTKSK